jgi:hypothetical protein
MGNTWDSQGLPRKSEKNMTKLGEHMRDQDGNRQKEHDEMSQII